jgi:hypothetical protein
MVIAATDHETHDYDLEAVNSCEHLGTSKKSMISFIDKGHTMLLCDEQLSIMQHFSVAFLGYYLQGKDDYAKYFFEEFVAQSDDLAWGVYKQRKERTIPYATAYITPLMALSLSLL